MFACRVATHFLILITWEETPNSKNTRDTSLSEHCLVLGYFSARKDGVEGFHDGAEWDEALIVSN